MLPPNPKNKLSNMVNMDKLQISVWTIGHSKHEVHTFIELLKSNSIEAIADVRSTPYSQMYQQFNREALSRDLRDSNISYSFFGDSLGGRPPEDELYDESGYVYYNRVSKIARFQDGVDALVELAKNKKVALMCSEGSPINCHRTLLVGRVLLERGIVVNNILPDGSIQKLEINYDRFEWTLLGEEEIEWRSAVLVRLGTPQEISSHD